jgi:hypothetical protein
VATLEVARPIYQCKDLRMPAFKGKLSIADGGSHDVTVVDAKQVTELAQGTINFTDNFPAGTLRTGMRGTLELEGGRFGEIVVTRTNKNWATFELWAPAPPAAPRGPHVDVELGSVRKLVLACGERLSTIVCTKIHIKEAQHLGSASTDGPRMGTDP